MSTIQLRITQRLATVRWLKKYKWLNKKLLKTPQVLGPCSTKWNRKMNSNIWENNKWKVSRKIKGKSAGLEPINKVPSFLRKWNPVCASEQLKPLDNVQSREYSSTTFLQIISMSKRLSPTLLKLLRNSGEMPKKNERKSARRRNSRTKTDSFSGDVIPRRDPKRTK